MPIKAILFDFDDTLADEAGSFKIALTNVACIAAQKHSVDVPRLVESAQNLARAAWHASPVWEMGRKLGVSSSEVFHGGFWEAEEASRLLRAEGDRFRPIVWRDALAEQGIVDSPLIEELVAASVAEGTGPHEPYPGTAEVLTGLSLLRPLGVITNGNSEIQRRKVMRSGLKQFFQVIVVSGDAGLDTAKPDPAPFRRALDELGVGPGDAVMVGNDPVNDIYGAACLGMRTVWVNRTGDRFPAEMPPDHEITDLRELPAVLGL